MRVSPRQDQNLDPASLSLLGDAEGLTQVTPASKQVKFDRGLGSKLAYALKLHLPMFGSVYFAQGAIVAYFNNFQKPYLDSLGISANFIGLLGSILLFPFILKIAIGLLSDRVNLLGLGNRKPYIVIGLLMSLFALATASLVNPTQSLALFAILLFLASLGMATFDTTADGLAIEITERTSQGAVQASMVAGRAIGLMAASWLFGVLAEKGSYSYMFLVLSGCMLLPLMLVLRYREPEDKKRRAAFEWGAFKELIRPRSIIFSVYLFVCMLIMWGGVHGLVTFYMSHDLKALPSQIGTYGMLVGVGLIAGALFAGVAIDRWSLRALAVIAVLGVSLSAVCFALTSQISAMYFLAIVWGIAFGLQQTVLVSLAMRMADVRIPASMFTIMMTIGNVGLTAGEGITTALTDDLGFANVFWMLAGVNLILLVLLYTFFKTAKESLAARDSGEYA